MGNNCHLTEERLRLAQQSQGSGYTPRQAGQSTAEFALELCRASLGAGRTITHFRQNLLVPDCSFRQSRVAIFKCQLQTASVALCFCKAPLALLKRLTNLVILIFHFADSAVQVRTSLARFGQSFGLLLQEALQFRLICLSQIQSKSEVCDMSLQTCGVGFCFCQTVGHFFNLTAAYVPLLIQSICQNIMPRAVVKTIEHVRRVSKARFQMRPLGREIKSIKSIFVNKRIFSINYNVLPILEIRIPRIRPHRLTHNDPWTKFFKIHAFKYRTRPTFNIDLHKMNITRYIL